jgi:poly(glycerol-phosphate) alpha-glucosyltransferase
MLLYLGRLHPIKGLSKLIEAWSMVRKEADKAGWRLVIAGWDQNGHRKELETLAAKLDVSSRVSFVGPQFGAAKASYFREATTFILPSLGEAMPVTVLEAWSWRLPVLITPQCNLPEGAAAGAAIMMEPEVDSISMALGSLFSMSDTDLETMGTNGRRLVEERFEWPCIGRQMADVYDWMLGGTRPSTVETWE